MMLGLWLQVWMAGTADAGIPLPYSPERDDCVSWVLLCCFLLSSYALSHSHKFLFQLAHDFVVHRERASIFAISTGTDLRYLFLLLLQTCVLSGLFLFVCSGSLISELGGYSSSLPVLGGYVGCCVLYLFVKWLLYSCLGWIFFNRNTVSFWLESYSTLLYYLGFGLFLSILFIVYFHIPLQISVIIGLVLLGLVKILILYKWIKLFCHNLFGGLLLILYFCALEIIPCMMLYSGLTQLNDYLTINF